MLEVSQLTTEQFMHKFAPKDDRIRILSAAPDDVTSQIREIQEESQPAEVYSPLVGKIPHLAKRNFILRDSH